MRPNGLELKLTAQFGRVTLRGIIDRLEIDDDGEFVVTDYKTGSVPSEFAENARLSGVHIYAALCEQMLGKRPARVQLYYLSKPEAIIATPTEQSVAGVGRRADALWAAILRACERDDFRPHTGPLCDYCTFKPYCPAFGGDPVQAAELRGPGTMIEPQPPARRRPALTGGVQAAALAVASRRRASRGCRRRSTSRSRVLRAAAADRDTCDAVRRASPTPSGSGARDQPRSASPRGSRSTSACA